MVYFRRSWPVSRWNAFDGVGNSTIDQSHIVARYARSRTTGKTILVQGCKQQVTRCITGKRPPGRICTVQTRRETDYQQPRIGAAKSRNRQTVVIGKPVLLFYTVSAKTRTTLAALQVAHSRSIRICELDHPLLYRYFNEIDFVMCTQFFQQAQAVGTDSLGAKAEFV